MATAVVDPTYTPGCYVFGYTLPGLGYFGAHRLYNQQSIFGLRPFGGEVCGKNTEADVFGFLFGSKNPKSPYWKNGSWHQSISPWPLTSAMSVQHRGIWGKRAILYYRKGRQVIRRYTPDSGAAKDYLVPWQIKLMEAYAIWKPLGAEVKLRLDRDARQAGIRCTGHNYFTKLYIQNNPRWHTYV